jgi:hypothetical protein
MSASDIVACAIGVVGAIGMLWLLPGWWRNERGLHVETPAPNWPWSPAAWRVLVRTWPALALTWCFMVPTAIIGTLSPDHGVAFVLVGVFGVAPLLALMFCCITVALFNRPRFLVAQHVRDQPGLVQEWRGRRPTHVPPPGQPPPWHETHPQP